MLPDIPKASWRPALEGWSDDILPFYRQIAEWLPPDGTVVEVGTAHGRSAVYLAEQLLRLGKPDVALYCVDFWPGAEFDKILRTVGWPDLALEGQRERSGRATIEEARLLRLVRCDGVQAARLFDDDSLDLVFIDSDHTYEGMMAHLPVWSAKVKPTGIIAGHDYNANDWPGVVQAVDEYFGSEVRRPTRSVWEFRYAGGSL